jgi:hypothetical protein
MRKFFKKAITPLLALGIALSLGAFTKEATNNGLRTEAAILTDSISAKGWGGYTGGSYSAVGVDYSDDAPTSGATLAMQIFIGSTGQVRGNKSGAANFSLRNTSEYPGYIRKITLTVTGGTLTSSTSRSVVSLGDLPFSGDYVDTTGAFTADVIGASQASLTWTIPTGTNYRYFKLHSLQTSGNALAAAADAIQIYYEEVAPPVFGTLDKITLDTTSVKTDYIVGNTYTSEGLIVVAHDTDGNFKSVTNFTTDYDAVVFTNAHAGTKVVTVSYSEGGITKTATYNIEVTIPTMLDAVTATSSLQFGATYALADPVTGNAMNTTVSNFFGAYGAVFVSNSLAVENQTQLFTLEIGNQANSFAFKLVNGPNADKYIQLGTDANYLTTKTTIDDKSSWTISIAEGVTTITSVAFPNRSIKYNSTDPRFATYKSGQNDVTLFVQTSTISDATAVNRLVTEINTGRGNSAFEQCGHLVEVFDGAYNQLSAAGKTLFNESTDADIVAARNRLLYMKAWVDAQPATPPVRHVENERNTISATVAISVIGLTAMLGYYFLTKKKRIA